MRDGFIRVAASTPNIKVADCIYNGDRTIEKIEEAMQKEVNLIVFPELGITGYTCGDLFLQETLLKSALRQVERIKDFSADKDILIIVGFPFDYREKIYNVAAVIQSGQVLGLVPKLGIPNYSELYEGRIFSSGIEEAITISFLGEDVLFGSKILFESKEMTDFRLAVEICEDLWIPQSPGVSHCLAGATVIANLSASDELIGKDDFRREMVKGQSSRLICGYIYANAGEGESTTDLVFAGHNMIAENGTILEETELFTNDMVYTELDLEKLKNLRRRKNTYHDQPIGDYLTVYFSLDNDKESLPRLELTRRIEKSPFVPNDPNQLKERCKKITDIQSMGLKTRMKHIGTDKAIIGVSGGSDSTLALLVVEKAFEELGYDKKGIIAVTMPCFGTTDRTYNNSIALARCVGATFLDIPIDKAVKQHFKDIDHDINQHDITYENSQARERTQVLMDLANKYNGIVIGTGDMSELALGWATFNGDHMSMYAVNTSIPKTMVKHLIDYFGQVTNDQKLKEVIGDILDTPVSPELLPPKEGKIAQITENYVGPYELHDFFLYYLMRFGFEPKKIFRLAKIAFARDYDEDTILKWLKVFYRRFFSQQFKRSTLPDGPKVGTVSLSPRGNLRMPSDASSAIWLKQLEEM